MSYLPTVEETDRMNQAEALHIEFLKLRQNGRIGAAQDKLRNLNLVRHLLGWTLLTINNKEVSL